MFRQASNHCSRVLETAKLAYANIKNLSLPKSLALGTFGELLIVFLTNVNLLYLLNSTVRRYYFLHLKAKLLKTS